MFAGCLKDRLVANFRAAGGTLRYRIAILAARRFNAFYLPVNGMSGRSNRCRFGLAADAAGMVFRSVCRTGRSLVRNPGTPGMVSGCFNDGSIPDFRAAGGTCCHGVTVFRTGRGNFLNLPCHIMSGRSDCCRLGLSAYTAGMVLGAVCGTRCRLIGYPVAPGMLSGCLENRLVSYFRPAGGTLRYRITILAASRLNAFYLTVNGMSGSLNRARLTLSADTADMML